MPLYSHHHRPSNTNTTTTSSSSYTSKPTKPHKTISSPTPSKILIAFSIFSFIVGIVGISFSIETLRKTQPLPVFRCRKAEDTLRGFLSVSRSRKLGGDSGGNGHGVGGGGGEVLVERTKLLGFVGIYTGFDSSDRREALRNTWFPSDPDGILSLEQATGLAFRFVIGLSKDAKKMASLRKEVEKYKDFLLIDVDEDYAKLPYKTLVYFRAAFELFEADYYVKADDDVYLRPDRLATLLAKERTHSRTYIGCMKKGPVVTDPKKKWYEKSGDLLGKEYFLHAYGPMYILSAEVVASLAVARNDSLRMFSNEDVTIGSWMLSMNVHHEDNRAICDPQCTPTSIAVWDIPKCPGLCNPVSEMMELHKIDMCSKSPTLPSDDEEE